MTDDFIAHLKAAGSSWDLDQTTEFVVVAATLLDLKAARLIPSGEVEDPEDLALLEARDLLFARLLAYRAFKQVAAWLERTLAAESRRAPRTAGLEPQFARLLPEVELSITPGGVRGAGRPGDGAEARRGPVAGPPARTGGERHGAGVAPGRPAAPAAGGDVPLADRGRRPADHGRPVPGPAGAVP